MTDTLARGSLTTRTYSVVTECLRIQSSARRQTRLAWLFGQDPVLPDARPWYRGALGELEVARTLRALGPEWTVLRCTDPAAEAPDLLLGPAGAYTVAVKNHSRQRVWVGPAELLVNGHRTNHLQDARHHARRLSTQLGIIVTPIVAVVDPATLALKPGADGVEVLAASQLGRYLSRRKPRFGPVPVPAGWEAYVPGDARVEGRIARLKVEVDAAWRRRVLWVAGLLIGVAALAFPASLGN